jgi:8-oxo-dGTP pyrophosphatase MutT (NUDIX family)
MNTRWKPSTTVAAVIEKDGLFLLVEEHTPEGLRLNNPAGHLDPGESPEQGCAREALEETAFDFAPTALVGIYVSRFQRPTSAPNAGLEDDITYLRFAFCGDLGLFHPERTLGKGIVRTVWMSADAIRNSTAQHRSPLVLQCMEDYIAGRRYPMALISTDASVYRS